MNWTENPVLDFMTTTTTSTMTTTATTAAATVTVTRQRVKKRNKARRVANKCICACRKRKRGMIIHLVIIENAFHFVSTNRISRRWFVPFFYISLSSWISINRSWRELTVLSANEVRVCACARARSLFTGKKMIYIQWLRCDFWFEYDAGGANEMRLWS